MKLPQCNHSELFSRGKALLPSSYFLLFKINDEPISLSSCFTRRARSECLWSTCNETWGTVLCRIKWGVSWSFWQSVLSLRRWHMGGLASGDSWGNLPVIRMPIIPRQTRTHLGNLQSVRDLSCCCCCLLHVPTPRTSSAISVLPCAQAIKKIMQPMHADTRYLFVSGYMFY